VLPLVLEIFGLIPLVPHTVYTHRIA
jgi:hypothetical protein